MSKLFPELEGVNQPISDSAAPVRPKPVRKENIVIIGGKWSIKKFDELMGLPGPFTKDGGCHVQLVKAFSDGRIEIHMMGGGVPRKTIWFRPAGSGRARLVCEQFEVISPGAIDDDALETIMGQIAHRLKKVSLQALRKVVFVDPEKKLETVPAPASASHQGDAKDMLQSLVQSYGSPEAWHNFFADREQQRNYCHNLIGAVIHVGHEDLECHYATPNVGDGTVSFFNYPRVHERLQPASNNAQSGPAEELISDLQDLDIIKGGAKKLDQLLDGLAGRDKKPELIIMRATCVPIVIGDDMEGSVNRFKGKHSIPIVYQNNLADQYATPFRETFNKIKQDPEFNNPQKQPGSINLVGFPKLTEMGPLIEFLKELEITINSRLLPDMDINVIKRYKAAELSVLFDTELYKKTYDEVIGGIDLRTIAPAAPYGIAGTRRWLYEIAVALGREGEFNDVWDRSSAKIREQWESLRKEAADYRLGFVVDSGRIKMLTEPRKTMGIPMIAAIKEMGFQLEFLCYSAADTHPKVAVSEHQEDGKIRFFKTPVELEELLKDSSAQAFYSDVFFDRRLTRCGKSQFSVHVFEMGLGGALATLQRLLSICKMPFYRKYGEFLGRAF